MTGLELDDISHRFGARTVVDRVSLGVERGEVLCLLGPSGCGKTTTLRVVAGLEGIQSGAVRIDGETIASPGSEVAPEKRRIGMVFQDYALFPHLTVLENVTFGLRRTPDRNLVARTLLQRLHMEEFADAFPHLLSGGEQQRVALARALAPGPHAMLLDEPFANLDARLRAAVRDDTLALLQAKGAATLMVTHDPAEALRMADRLAIMRDGRIEQIDTPDRVFSNPANRFCAEFLSEFSVLEGGCRDGMTVEAGPFRVPARDASARGEVDLLIRPEALCFRSGGEDAKAEIVRVRNVGSMLLVDARMQHSDAVLRGHWGDARRPDAGDMVNASLVPEKVFVFPRKTP